VSVNEAKLKIDVRKQARQNQLSSHGILRQMFVIFSRRHNFDDVDWRWCSLTKGVWMRTTARDRDCAESLLTLR